MDRYVVKAPSTLGRETHEQFRREALEVLESSPPSALVIDVAATGEVDSAGLGALVVIQRRAAELRRPVHLRDASEELRLLLVMTRLDDRFVFESTPPA